MKKQPIVCISGPTASGKSALAVELALALKKQGQHAEIISCDSMQIYKGMDIGTGKVTEEEKQGVVHRMLDILEPSESCSLADFAALAHSAIDDCAKNRALPILCGGTGLYLDNILYETTLSDAPCDQVLREELEKEENEALHARLAAVDPQSAQSVHPNNKKRVIRALEIYLLTGQTKSAWDARSRQKTSRYDARRIYLLPDAREVLYEKINRRVQGMFDEGLEVEVRALYEKQLSPTAAQAIGYKEFLPYFRGDCTLDAVKEEIMQASRNYAKRQLTWFKKSIGDACGEGGVPSNAVGGSLVIDCALPRDEQLRLALAYIGSHGQQ